jgi:hypothetical protein
MQSFPSARARAGIVMSRLCDRRRVQVRDPAGLSASGQLGVLVSECVFADVAIMCEVHLDSGMKCHVLPTWVREVPPPPVANVILGPWKKAADRNGSGAIGELGLPC